MSSRRTLVALATATLAPFALVAQASQPGTAAERAPAQDGRYHATITRTAHGIPHVTADDFGSLGFGHGYATAETNICNLADTLVTGRGERSKWFGPRARYEDRVTLSATNLQTDTLFRDLRQRKVVETLLADPVRGPSDRAKAMVRGYVAGVNSYLEDVGGADGVGDPSCNGAGYLTPTVTAKDLWYGVYAANLLASAGVFVPQIADADPPAPDDPGTPVGAADGFAEPPAVLPSRAELLEGLGKDPESPFGSNATAVGGAATTTGKGMVLGNPHFPWRGRYRFGQVHLTIPGKYDVAGAALLGSPVVNIGWNKNVAWSHTVSTAYRFTPYEYRYTQLPDGSIQYATDGGPKKLHHDVVEIEVKGKNGTSTVEEDLYRTDEGFVIDAPDLLMGWTPTSFFAIRDANGEHLRTIDTFLDMGAAKNVKDLLRRQDEAAGMPWVNTTAADRFGDVVYADHSVVPNVPDDMAQPAPAGCLTPVGKVLFELAGLPGLDGTRAESDCKWRTDADASRPGIFGPKNLPITYRRDWVANANDSYWLPNPKQRLEGFARIIGCEECERTLRTRMVYRYVMDRLAGKDGLGKGKRVSPRTLRLFQHTNRVFGAELSRRHGDLQKVCEAAEGGRACKVLARWDGKSDVDSVGTHIFQEFWNRVPADKAWEVPFDPAHPVSTPRNLNEGDADVIQAMRDALDYLKEQDVPFDATWGSVQVAGDEGAPLIPLGGGDAGPGNANVLTSRMPASHRDKLHPVSYGSSHIQGVAFLPDGKVNARTILTYSQSTDPTSPFSADQTRMFSKEKWVRFAFTPRQVRRGAISTEVVSGG